MTRGFDPGELHINVEYRPCAVHCVVDGEVDVANCDALRAALRLAFDRHVGRVILDMHGIAFLDVHGLRSIEWAVATARASGQCFVIRQPSPAAQRTMSFAVVDLAVDNDPDAA